MKLDQTKYADIEKVTDYLGRDIAGAMPQLHSVTGCDTTSYFYKVGKVSVLKKLLKDPSQISLITDLGKDKEMHVDTIKINALHLYKQ